MPDFESETGIFSVTGASVELKVFRRPNPDHTIYNLIGRIASDWSLVEHLLDLIIWQLANLDEATGACLTSQILGSQGRLQTIEALCRKRGMSNQILGDIKSLSKELKGMQTRRNRILHDPWYIQDETNEPNQFKAMPKDEWLTGFRPINEEYLKETLEKFSRRIALVSDLRNSITAVL